MQLTPETKRKTQIVLAIVIAVSAARAGYIVYQRYAEKAEEAGKQPERLPADYYVTPKKLYPYDLKSARQLTQQPVWVKEGYRYTYYPYVRPRVDFRHEAGTLLPIEKLQISDVITDVSPDAPGRKQVMAVFEQAGKTCAVPIGFDEDGNYKIYSDEMFYIQDPHELYKHWPADVWNAIEKHEVKPGMNELQVDFAIGMGALQRSGDSAVRILNYPDGGKPLSITFREGKATEIRPGT